MRTREFVASALAYAFIIATAGVTLGGEHPMLAAMTCALLGYASADAFELCARFARERRQARR